MAGGDTSAINVDNIFASMTPTTRTESTEQDPKNSSTHPTFFRLDEPNANNIFANFQPALLSSTPPRKYSDSNVDSRFILNTASVRRSDTGGVGKVAQDGELSKSMCTGFLRSSLQRSNSNITANSFGTSSIRHAGYLLKRSNLPYNPIPQPPLSDEIEIAETLAPSPPPSDGSGAEFDNIQHLPFGGFGSNSALFEDEDVDESASDMLETSPLKVAMSAGRGASVLGGPDNLATSEDPDRNDAGQCFCSPVVEFVRQLVGMQTETFVEETNGQHDGFMTPPVVVSSTATTPRRLSSDASGVAYSAGSGSVSNRYSLPLKEPGRSDPVPISPPKNRKVMTATDSLQRPTTSLPKTNSDGRLSSYDSGQQLRHSGGGNVDSTNYPPPPPDYLAKDGHIWRAKYCVLENGILYFYRTAAEGESHEAQLEREESRLYALETLSSEIFLGEEIVTTSSPSNQIIMSPATISLPKRQLSNGSTGRQPSRQMSNHDLHDLSKSPVPMRKGDYYMEQGQQARANPFNRQGSSVITRLTSSSTIGETGREHSGSGNNDGKLYHSNSTSTFNHDAEILWEKRVSLDCVGAVRSSKQDGDHVFELLAFGIEDRDDMSVEGGTSLRPSIDRQDSNEIVDRLTLRAGGTDEMNAWMFELYRALRDRSMQSFMQQVNSLRGSSRPSGFDDSSIHDISRCNTSPRDSIRRRLAPLHSQGSNVVGPAMSPSTYTKSSFASSPIAGGSFGGSNFSPNIVGSLSHGHGRNALFRRQMRDGTTTDASPSSTPGGSPLDPSLLKKKPQIPSLSTTDTIQSDPSKGQGKKELSTFKDLRETKDRQSPPPIFPKRPGAGAGKYIPPHQRNKAGAGKYVPPHLRNRQSNDGSPAAAALVNDESKQSPAEIRLSPALANSTKAQINGEETPDETLSDSSDITASSLLGRQLGTMDEESNSHIIRLGGCADPSVVVGSIIDAHFIPRKASVVGNARLEAYGGFGGGAYSSETRNERMNPKGSVTSSSPRSALKWEVGASSECGVRTSNEDSYVAINNLDKLIETQGLVSFSSQDNFTQTKQQGLYAIFDGHVGNQAARFSAEMFPEILMEEQSLLASTDSASLSSIEERVDTMLQKSFDRLDRDFCVLCTTDGRNWDCGSTALVAVIVDDVVSLANLGDCRGVVGRVVATSNSETSVEDGWEEIDQQENNDDGRLWDRASGSLAPTSVRKLFWKEMTDTHSPIFAEEQARIERANGWIIEETEIPIGQLHRMDIFDKDVVEIVKRCFANRMKQNRSDPVRKLQIGRTCGDLAVSRAIGDRDFKAAYNSGTTDEQRALSSNSWAGPDVFLYPEGHSGLFYGDIVSNTPDIRTFKVGSAGVLEEFLLMACDGLWDVMDSDDAVRIAKNLLYEKRLSAKDGAARLAELAQHLGSSDNITVILIRFYWDDMEEG